LSSLKSNVVHLFASNILFLFILKMRASHLIVLIILVIAAWQLFGRRCVESYAVATDSDSHEVFDRLKKDLEKLYPDLSKLNLRALVSCIPEDSYTEDKKHISICVRAKSGKMYPYSKLLKIGIHELAHAMSKQMDPDHVTPEFINNYSSLMSKARSLGYDVEP
jgi:hypothetical protein